MGDIVWQLLQDPFYAVSVTDSGGISAANIDYGRTGA